MEENNEKIRPSLLKLEVGETITFCIEKMKSVRTLASELGAIMNRRYQTRTDREARTITVKRLA